MTDSVFSASAGMSIFTFSIFASCGAGSGRRFGGTGFRSGWMLSGAVGAVKGRIIL
jgi:hypothetical protein